MSRYISFGHLPTCYDRGQQCEYVREPSHERGLKSWLVCLVLHWACLVDIAVIRHYLGFYPIIYSNVVVDTITASKMDSPADHYLFGDRLVFYKAAELLARIFAVMPGQAAQDWQDWAKLMADSIANARCFLWLSYELFTLKSFWGALTRMMRGDGVNRLTEMKWASGA